MAFHTVLRDKEQYTSSPLQVFEQAKHKMFTKNRLNPSMNYCALFRKYRVVLTCIQMKNRGLLSIQTYMRVSVCLFLKDSLTKVENTPPCSFLKHLHFQWIRCCLLAFILALVCVDVCCISIAIQKHSSLRIEAQTTQVSKR